MNIKSSASQVEDVHFYIDNAPPEEVLAVLRMLPTDRGMTSLEISQVLAETLGFVMQKAHGYSPRRLFDLGLATTVRMGSSLRYSLTSAGVKLQLLASTDRALVFEAFHMLHYSGFSGSPQDRKLFWSYRFLCNMVWRAGRLGPPKDLAAAVQDGMSTRFPHLDMAKRRGTNFSSQGVSQGMAWVRALDPTPITQGGLIAARRVNNPGLVVWALDIALRDRDLPYGNSVLLDTSLLDLLCQALFVTHADCRDLLAAAARIYPSIRLSQTLAGVSVSLTKAFAVHNL